ncbi:Cyclic di-GMP phosphodiesterase Gmr [Thiorhodovibrio winogradskyi]|uniref:Cyclic di-GMP phosphodiesterase Gmr n=1 Tax=Thiorhodovibrio winogradskyi TaxID=77007 RepID=A0ABZ0SD67_9GAMM|nr:EAL domain-containing protein [Thiorhodovibrio winogradskyi]
MFAQTTPLKLDSAHDLHAALFNAMTDGVLVVNRQGLIIDCNPAFHRRLGYRKDELTGRSVTTLDPPEFAAQVPRRLAEIEQQGQATFETAHYRKDGSVMPVELNARSFQVGSELVFFSVVRDISERKEMETRLHEGIETYEAAVNTTTLGFWMVDMDGCFLEVNAAYLKLSGYSRDEFLRLRIPDIEALEQPAETARHIAQIIRDGSDRFRSEHRRQDGSRWPVEVVTSFSRVQGGRFFVFIEDISERVVQEHRLQLAARVFDTMDQAVVVTDASNRIVSINPAAVRITGYTFDEVRGKDPSIFASGRHDRAFYDAMWASLHASRHWEGEIWDRRKDGTLYAKWLGINAIHDSQGALYQYVSVFSDITERKKTEELVWRQANFDALTGLPNRHLFYERLEQEIKKAGRTRQGIAVLFIDLDRFKEVNDSLGHAKGDALLAQAAGRIGAKVRESDTVARLGGDEFTVVLPNFGDRANLERIARELIMTLAEPYELGDDDRGYISASIGITLFPDDADNLDGLLKHADQAMYVAKAEGRNRFGYFTATMQREAREKAALAKDLRQALGRGELEVYYQPIVDMTDEVIVKAEALLRWYHPERGLVSPMVFIPLAEELGLIHEIGQWVFGQALAAVARWRDMHDRIIQVSVNRSPIQFEKPNQPCCTDELRRFDLPGHSITVEITEGSLLSQSKHIEQQLLEFRNAGIEVSIDDFGTGFSALSYLRRFDIDYLKIDRSFISDLAEDDANTALTEAIIVMAHKLGIQTIAEGVETERQRDLLRQFGCDYAQGYLYAPALQMDAFEQLLGAA